RSPQIRSSGRTRSDAWRAIALAPLCVAKTLSELIRTSAAFKDGADLQVSQRDCLLVAHRGHASGTCRRPLLGPEWTSPAAHSWPLLGLAAAIIGLAEACRLGVVLRAKPALRIVQAGIGAAGLQMIDADIAGNAGAHGVFALDGAAGGHHGIGREQDAADLLVAVGAA